MSLPRVFRTNLQTIPRNIPYLHSDPTRVAIWRERLRAFPEARNLGLVWAGRPTHANDRNRSIPLSLLAPLAEIPNTRFISLQKGPPAEQIRSLPPNFVVTDLTSDLHDFADTAALIQNLDLVIAVDTAVAHLAGALGKPLWLLLPHRPDWRWMLDRTDSPWYPTVKLYRQAIPSDWTKPIEGVVRDLIDLTSHR